MRVKSLESYEALSPDRVAFWVGSKFTLKLLQATLPGSNFNPAYGLGVYRVEGVGLRIYLWLHLPTALWVLPTKYGVITTKL